MQVAVGAGHLNLPVGQSAQAGGQRGQVGSQHTGVGHEDDVCLQQFLVFPAESLQAGRANFFLAFENEFHVDFQFPAPRQVFEGLGLDERLSFVVIGSACPDTSVAHFGFKRSALPEFQRFGGHHIVVGVHQHGLCLGGNGLLGEHHGVAGRGHHVCLVRSRFQQELAPALGAGQHVVFVFGLGTDAGDADEAEQFVQHPRLVVLDIVFYHD